MQAALCLSLQGEREREREQENKRKIVREQLTSLFSVVVILPLSHLFIVLSLLPFNKFLLDFWWGKQLYFSKALCLSLQKATTATAEPGLIQATKSPSSEVPSFSVKSQNGKTLFVWCVGAEVGEREVGWEPTGWGPGTAKEAENKHSRQHTWWSISWTGKKRHSEGKRQAEWPHSRLGWRLSYWLRTGQRSGYDHMGSALQCLKCPRWMSHPRPTRRPKQPIRRTEIDGDILCPV